MKHPSAVVPPPKVGRAYFRGLPAAGMQQAAESELCLAQVTAEKQGSLVFGGSFLLNLPVDEAWVRSVFKVLGSERVAEEGPSAEKNRRLIRRALQSRQPLVQGVKVFGCPAAIPPPDFNVRNLLRESVIDICEEFVEEPREAPSSSTDADHLRLAPQGTSRPAAEETRFVSAHQSELCPSSLKKPVQDRSCLEILAPKSSRKSFNLSEMHSFCADDPAQSEEELESDYVCRGVFKENDKLCTKLIRKKKHSFSFVSEIVPLKDVFAANQRKTYEFLSSEYVKLVKKHTQMVDSLHFIHSKIADGTEL